MSGGKYKNGTKRMSVAGIPFLQHKPVTIMDSEGNDLLDNKGGTSFEDLGYSPFSETETYAAGDVVIYDGSLYKFTASHTGAWTGTDATATSVHELMKLESMNRDFAVASKIGMKPYDTSSSAKEINYTALAHVIEQKKNLILDGEYSFSVSEKLSIDYDFVIKGGSLHFDGKLFSITSNGGLSFIDVNIVGGTQAYIITIADLDYVIEKISFKDCTFSGLTRVASISSQDLDYSQGEFGLSEFVLSGCTFFDANSSQFVIIDTPLTKCCLIENNTVYGMKYNFVNFGRTNEFTNNNVEYYCDVVFSGNKIYGGGVLDNGSTYYTPLLAECNRVFYTNNFVCDLIAVGDYPAYDGYISSKYVYFANNEIRDIISLYKDTTGKAFSEIGKSKGGGGNREFFNNSWNIDATLCRQKCAEKNITFTDEEWNATAIVEKFVYTGGIDTLVFNNNLVNIKGCKFGASGSSWTIDNVIMKNNVFDVKINAVLVPIWGAYYDQVKQEKHFVFTNNIIKNEGTEFEVFDRFFISASSSRNSYVQITDNISNVVLSPVTRGKCTVYKNNVVTNPVVRTSASTFSSESDYNILEISLLTNTSSAYYVESNCARITLQKGNTRTNSLYIKPINGNRKVRFIVNELDLDKTVYLIKETKEGEEYLSVYDEHMNLLLSHTGSEATSWLNIYGTSQYYNYLRIRISSTYMVFQYTEDSGQNIKNDLVVEVSGTKRTSNALSANDKGLFRINADNITETWNGTSWVASDGLPSYKNRGDSSERPTLTSSDYGFQFFDTSLSKFICWNGTEWVNLDGTALS